VNEGKQKRNERRREGDPNASDESEGRMQEGDKKEKSEGQRRE